MIFGPVFYYDLVRLSRRGRYILLRTLYGLGLAALLCLVYLEWHEANSGDRIDVTQLTQFTESFFYTLMGVQFAVVVLLTPAYVAGAIAEEKERRTLEFLFATDLRDREIVLGKLASRLANLTLLLLTGLPILSLLQFLGGVDPGLVLAGFAATGVTLLSLGGLSLLNSVLARRAREAIVYTYLAGVAYLAVAGLSLLLLIPDLGFADFPSTANWTSPLTVADVVKGFNAGNIFYCLARLFDKSSGSPSEELWGTLRDYAIFHGTVALVCISGAVYRLRQQALKESITVKAAKGRWTRRRWRSRPPVGDRPMVWKEVYAESGARTGWFHRAVMLVLVVASIARAAIIVGVFIASDAPYRAEERTATIGWMARIVGSLVTCLVLLGVGVRASGSLTGERERQTLDGLLTTPLDSDTILFGKWLGSILGQRWGWAWAASIIGLGVVTGGVHLLALPLLLLAWASYAAFMASLGLLNSTIQRTTLRANVATVAGAAMIGFGHWAVWMCCLPLAYVADSQMVEGGVFEWVSLFQAYGLTPPFTLGLLTFQGWEFENGLFLPGLITFVKMLLSAVIGIALYAGGAYVLWRIASRRFRETSGRVPQHPRPAAQKPVQAS
jgi:ABC-type transport system involved in multi-copper enzyme maturation permease subunit